jgi:NAD(P)-dependent dehydrogenase (short-subunit alcohol dehydrogenase family)
MTMAAPLAGWRGRALVVGCGGIGSALLDALALRAPGLELVGTCRHPLQLPEGRVADTVKLLSLDVTSDASLAALRSTLEEGPPLRLVIYTAGLLHAKEMAPEKRLSQVQRHNLSDSFQVNAFGPLLLAQAVQTCLPKEQPCHFASLSARVGSITDNHLGGWYSYRAAKAAQNQLLRTLAVEWRRRLPLTCVSLLHPGTTATDLSAPFQANVPAERLFPPSRAANHLIDILEGLEPEQSGSFWAWDGTSIPW